MAEDALRATPARLTEELTRFGGVNPWGLPVWRVVRAELVRRLRFGTMRHMPQLNADSAIEDLMEIEPERYSSGAMWLPRYSVSGWILERWFPAEIWGSAEEWESQLADDGVTRRMGPFPRHGDYQMVTPIPFEEMPGIEFWKEAIARELREEAERPADPAENLGRAMYLERVAEELRREAFLEEVNHAHRATVEPVLAAVGGTAQRIRDGLAAETGWPGHISAG